MPQEIYKNKLDSLFNYRNIHWTYDSKNCYKRGCVCRNCQIYSILGKKCQMKKMVIELVRTIGKPRNITTRQIIEV